MNFLDKLERKLGRFAIPNLMMYLIFGQVIVFFTAIFNARLIYNFYFSWEAILAGEIWRLVTFIFIPNSFSPLWFMLAAFIYYSIGSQLERVWGTFHFNFYYFISVVSTVIVCILFRINGSIVTYINLSLFLSYATLVPEATFYLYFIIPVKAKYMVYLYFGLMGYTILTASHPFSIFCLILASLMGYIIFFGIPFLRGQRMRVKRTGSYESALRHQQQQQRQNSANHQKKQPQTIKVAFHKCSTCGKTELDDPDLEFRYCSTCGKEYCLDHLKDHTH
ncbi:MAG: hypothetical protein BEN19_03695 [Epulopiscium sp. Nuni2H_MBin003]|nr:MAG: hypothetical protein BEN19_03695 [Epulopiscium sp. Nuni2H_MBin003]